LYTGADKKIGGKPDAVGMGSTSDMKYMHTIPELGWAKDNGAPTKEAADSSGFGSYLGQEARKAGFPLVYARWDYPKSGDGKSPRPWDGDTCDELFHAPSQLLHPKCGRNMTVLLANKFVPVLDGTEAATGSARSKSKGKSPAAGGAAGASWEGVSSPDASGREDNFATSDKSENGYEEEEWEWVPLPVLAWVLDPEYMYEVSTVSIKKIPPCTLTACNRSSSPPALHTTAPSPLSPLPPPPFPCYPTCRSSAAGLWSKC
jgi:hypothetical protein